MAGNATPEYLAVDYQQVKYVVASRALPLLLETYLYGQYPSPSTKASLAETLEQHYTRYSLDMLSFDDGRAFGP